MADVSVSLRRRLVSHRVRSMKLVPYVKARKQFGRPIAKFQNTQFQLADMQTKVDAARWLVYDAAMKKEKGLPYSVEAAKAKLFAAEVAMEVTTKAIQLLGGYGYTVIIR